MCRQQFSLKKIEESHEVVVNQTDKFIWFYESRGIGEWWAFDKNSSKEIEEAFTMGKDKIIINIAGYNYVIDFSKMQQYRKDTPNRIRRIKREENDIGSAKFNIKGIAGLHIKLCK